VPGLPVRAFRKQEQGRVGSGQALQLTPKDYDTLWWAIRTYDALQRPDLALAVLQQAPPALVADVSRHPDLARLHADSRFRQLLGQQQHK